MIIKTAVIRWDAVDVKLETGEKRFGYVVDIDDDGLVVDFGNGSPQSVYYRKIRQLLPPFQKLLRQSYYYNARKRTYSKRGDYLHPDPYDHEVVLQLSSKDAYTWFPARMLVERSFEYGYHFVEARIAADKVLACVVPVDHVRRAYSFKNLLQCRPVWTAFDKQRVPVPRDFVLNDTVREEWTRSRPESKIISVEDGYLYYLRENNKLIDMKSPERTVHEIMEKLKRDGEFAQPGAGAYPACQLPDINNVIPPEIMIKVFKFLTTEHQAKARSVCARWNVWLHLPEFVNKVRIDIPEMIQDVGSYGYENSDSDWGRKVAACIHKKIKKESCLMLTGLALPPNCAIHFHFGMSDMLRILENIARFTRITPINTLALSECDLSSSYIADDRPSTYIFQTKRCLVERFKWLHLKNVKVIDIDCSLAQASARDYDEDSFWPRTSLSIHVDSACLDLQSPSFACDVWNMLEKHCPSVDLQVDIVPMGLKFALTADPLDRKEWLLAHHAGMIIYAFESCDPRASEALRSKYTNFLDRSTANFAAVDIRSLKKLTLFMLERLFVQNYDIDKGKFEYPERLQFAPGSPAYSDD